MDKPEERADRIAVQHAVLDMIAAWVARSAPGRAQLQRFESETLELVELVVRPVNPNAAAIDVIAGRSEISIEFGQHDARWELTYDDECVALARRIVEAVVGGCTVESEGWFPAVARVTQDDGVVVTDAALLPLLPHGTWRGRHGSTRYQPY